MKQKRFLSMFALLLMAATGAVAQSTPITTVRSWDFTKGGRNSDWESAQEAATSVWGGKDSSFRYSNANNLSGEELTDGTKPLKGLAGIYFTAPAGSLLLGGVNSSTRCLQTNGDGVSILLPDCAAKDRITIRFCASVNNTTVTITSDQMKSSYVANSTDRSNEVSAFVKENGNVVLNVPSKVRIYEIKVEPYVAVTNFNLTAETVTVTENKTVTVTATGFSPSNAFDKTLEWTTADENVANVANGVITGVNPGTTTITVTSVDGPSKTIGVTVLPTYSVTLAEGTEDSDNWTISPTEAAEGDKVTVTYSGEKKVKSVKAVKKAATPAIDYSTAKLGDLFYSDGTFSTELEAGKTPIGVIAYLDKEGTDDDEICEKSNGAGHGLVLCLKNAASGAAWSTDEVSKFSGQEVNDAAGLKRTTNVSGYSATAALATDATTYPAAAAAKNYTGLTAPTSTTGWFLPSAQQWVKMQTGLGALEESSIKWNSWFDNNHEGADRWEAALSKAGSGNYDSMTSEYLSYWSSSEYLSAAAVRLSVDATDLGEDYGFSWNFSYKGYKENDHRVRPVLAF